MKRGNGAGSVEVRKDARGNVTGWRVRITAHDGSRKILGSNHKTELDARKVLAAFHMETLDGGIVTGGVSLATIGEAWLTRRELDGNKSGRKVKDIGNERSLWAHHIAASEIARLPVASIRPVDVEDWMRALMKKKAVRAVRVAGKTVTRETSRTVSPQTAKHALRLLRQCLDDALARELVSTNAAAGVSAPSNKQPTKWTFLTVDEIAKLETLPPRTALPLLFAVYTGARKGELWRMRWSDIDEARGRIRIHEDTKTGKERLAPLLPMAADVLAKWRGMSSHTESGDLIFCNEDGEAWSGDYDLGWDDKRARIGNPPELVVHPGARTKAGIARHVRFHDLRHTCASHLIMGSWGRAWRIEEVSAFLGHSSIQVTQRYAHLSDGHLDELARATVVPRSTSLDFDHTSKSPESFAHPSGIEPLTYGLEGRSDITKSDSYAAKRDNAGTTAARDVLRGAASGTVSRAAMVALAESIIGREDVRAATDVLAGGPLAVRRAIELAGMVLDAGEIGLGEVAK